MSYSSTPNRARVLLIAPQPFFSNRGTPLNVRAMLETLSGAGYEIDLLAYPFGEKLEIPGVSIIRSTGVPFLRSVPIGPSWRKVLLDIPLFFHGWLLVRKRGYALLHGIEEGALMAALYSKFIKVPYVFDMDSSMPDQLYESGALRIAPLLRLVSKVESWAAKNASAILTVCSALTNKAKKIDPQGKIYQIEDFPIASSQQVDRELIEKVKEEFDCCSKKIVLYTGNLESYQGIDLLLEGFAKFVSSRDEASNVRLLLVGGGGADSLQSKYYQEMAKRLGCSEQVIFAGPRPQKEMGSLMAMSDLLVSPRNEGENTPLKIYSYMASNTPILATDIFSHTQVLSSESAFLAKPNALSFGEGLEKALEDSEPAQVRRQTLAKNAFELANSRYSKAAFEKRLLAMYKELIGLALDNAQQVELDPPYAVEAG